MLTSDEKDILLHAIWRGTVDERRLPRNLYNDIAAGTTGIGTGLVQGFGSIESPASLTLINNLNKNAYFFSAAKTFQQVLEMQGFILDDQGFIRPFSAFQKDVNPIYEQFNLQWQRTEFDTTISQAQSASRWEDIQENKDALPLLQYQTAGDERVRPEHADWDNIVRRVDDPFWDTHTPP